MIAIVSRRSRRPSPKLACASLVLGVLLIAPGSGTAETEIATEVSSTDAAVETTPETTTETTADSPEAEATSTSTPSVEGAADELSEAEIADAESSARAIKRRTEFFPGPPAGQKKADLEEITKTRYGRRLLHRVNSRISRYLNAARDTQDEGNPAAGLALIARLNPKRLNPMERASVYLVEALLYYAAGDLDSTIASFKKVIAEDIMPIRQDINLRFNIAQILAGQYRWKDSIQAIYEWFEFVYEPTPIAYYLLGIANFQLGNMDLAIVNTEKALEIAAAPKEGWLQLLAALYIQDQDHANATPILEEMVMRFPKKAYWVQLALIYGARENYRASLAVQQVAYAQGFLTEDKGLRRLARSFLYADLPHPAAQVLEKGIANGFIESDPKSLELLANSWIAAREFEKSLPPLRLAAESAENGNLYLRLGQVFLQREDWETAARRFEDAIEKGDLKQPGQARLLLGIAYYNNAQVFRAKSSFIEAADHEKTRKDAEIWIDHLEREEQSS